MSQPKLPRLEDPSQPTIRSLPFDDWPAADQLAWLIAVQPSQRLKRGGAASHMREVTRRDLMGRYGLFLDHVKRTEGLDSQAAIAGYVTPARVARYVSELQGRVSSVTVYGSIYKLRRTAQLLTGQGFEWLAEIEKDLALVMQPRSKFDRVAYSHRLTEAGITLMQEAHSMSRRPALARALQFRDGLMIAVLATSPVRLKNLAALALGCSFRQIKDSWWIVLDAQETKEKRPDERPIPSYLNRWIELYLARYRPMLAGAKPSTPMLWLSRTGPALSYASTQRAIGQATLATMGIAISPHLFRTAAATTVAIHAGSMPHLASALLHHTHPAVTQEHYNRAGSLNAAQEYAAIVKRSRRTG